ncbi:MAG TPA: heme biosynthesis HemY N-terminal domain-containing protein [Alphaproteobacteria bacterium]|nr:heme biosynthesis HemY N-terminal domain-containing protein [Alphaproteobacteria bacterium]
MLQTLWFFIKVTVITVACVWIVSQPGSVSMSLAGYDLTIKVGVFFLLLGAFILFVLFFLSLVRGIFSMPRALTKYYEADQRKKSFRSLTRGLVAVAAGDAKTATKYSRQTGHLWPELSGLPLLLEAQAAQLRGEEGLAQNKFEHLLKDKDAAFLGVRGLMKAAIDKGDYARALDFAKQAEKEHPKKSWIVNNVYFLEIKNQKWEDALRTNHKIMKIKSLSEEKVQSDRVAIHLLQSKKMKKAGEIKNARRELETAYKLDPCFVPAAVRMADDFITRKNLKKAAQVVEKAWRQTPHPELARVWDDLAPVPKGKNPEKDNEKLSAWYEKLISFHPNHVEGYIAAARSAMDRSLWGEAKSYLMTAEKIYPSARIYRLQAIVEQHSTHNDEAIHDLMERAAGALPDKVWVCQETGQVYEKWSAVAKPHGSFNTIIWDYPGARLVQSQKNILCANESNLLLDIPA